MRWEIAKLSVTFLGCAALAGLMIVSWSDSRHCPDESELVLHEGRLATIERGRHGYVRFTLPHRDEPFECSGFVPDGAEIPRLIVPGATVRVWTDGPRGMSVWRLEAAGKRLLDIDAAHRGYRRNGIVGLVLGLAFAGAAMATAVRLWRRLVWTDFRRRDAVALVAACGAGLLAGCASPSPVPTSGAPTSGATVWSCTIERADGEVAGVRLGMSEADVAARLGMQTAVTREKSAVSDGDFVTLSFDGAVAEFDDGELVSLDVSSDAHVTSRGIRIGHDVQKVRRRYGACAPFTSGAGSPVLQYTLRGTDCHLSFELDRAGRRVTAIRLWFDYL